MPDIPPIVLTTFFSLIAIYAVVTGVFLIKENRRPQATLAWLLAFYLAPGIGVLIYVFFGRHWKAFSKQSKLLMQDLRPNALPILTPLLDRQDAEIERLEHLSTTHKKLMTLVRRNSHSTLTRYNSVKILQNADSFYPSMMNDMREARHSIHLQYFIWRDDPYTQTIKDLLLAKVKEGVEVRLLYDAIGSHRTLSRRYVKELRAGGVQIAPTSALYMLHTISYRNHRKITVIDGRIAYTGGMNIGEEHLNGGKGFSFWRDTQVRIVGEAAAVLQSVFMVDWYNAVRENLFAPDYFPTDTWNGTAKEPLEEDAETNVPVQILTSGPDSQWAAIQQLYSSLVVSAQKHVYVQSPYFVLDASLAEALRMAGLSGVDVRVMLSERASGNQLPEWAGNTFITDVINAGVRVFLYRKGYLHAKTISIDSEICSIGSANIDIRSFSINYELNAVLYSSRMARELEAAFHEDLADCTEFDAKAYHRRNVVLRFRDSLARLLSPLL